MKILRFKYNKKIYNGLFENNSVFDAKTKKEYDIEKIIFLPPVKPRKIICIGFNYHKHTEELKDIATKEPTLTLKAPNTIIGHNETIVLPEESNDIEHEAELGIVIKKGGYKIKNPEKHILGYTIVNDVTARDIEKRMIQWSASKSFPTFCPCGPFIETEINPENLEIQCKVNNKIRQKANTNQMIYSPQECVKFVSKFIALQPGDLISTGTPEGTGELKNGDIIEIKINEIGELKNTIKKTTKHHIF